MNMNQIMQAVFLDTENGVFITRKIEIPRPGPKELLVKISASGVNPLDIKIAQGKAPHARHSLPAILGMDMAGTVVEVGEGVTRFKTGDEIFGMTGGVGNIPGTLAEYAIVDSELVALKPKNMSIREAAALPLLFITAWEGLVDRAKVGKGDKVLIHGGAGGVGHIAIQLAKAHGAEVFATTSLSDMATAAIYGAIPINYETDSVENYLFKYTNGMGFDIVFDTVGGETIDKSFAAVRNYGHVVSCLGRDAHSLAPLSLKGATYSGIFTLLPLLTGVGRAHHGNILEEAARLYDKGQLKVKVDGRNFGLSEVDKAHQAILDKNNNGKLIINL